jgi:hypothetical protein
VVSVQSVFERPSTERAKAWLVDREARVFTIDGTPEHPVFVPEVGRYVHLGELRPGQRTLARDGTSATVLLVWTGTGEARVVHNLTIAFAANYFVGPGEVLVHNARYRSWSNQGVAKAANNLRTGSREVTVGSRADAEDLFVGMYAGKGYKNTTGRTGNQVRNDPTMSNGKSGTYHWDTNDTQHGGRPHLQIHDENGTVTRIFYGEAK